jgi:hypothetical protein
MIDIILLEKKIAVHRYGKVKVMGDNKKESFEF